MRCMLFAALLLTSHCTSGFVPFSPLTAPRAIAYIGGALHGASNAYQGPAIDLYRALNVNAKADASSIKRAYIKIAKTAHPDNFASELRFNASSLSVSALREYLDENQVGTATLVEKFELVEAAEVNHARTGKVNRALRERRDQITGAFANVALAYETLSDPKKRQMYDLTGEWGQEEEFVPPSSKQPGQKMGDRAEAERVRMRQQVQKMDEVQRRVYERNMQEEKMRKAAEEERMKQGEEERRRQREVTLKQREESRRKFEEWSKGGEGTDGNKPKKDLTDEEIRRANQDKVKKMWAGIFKTMGL
mmetsp:Transcript_18812/g.38543  ORF Transcript_18812/g.38543 Transcript_18812/m.38543 type:complete len:306 (-) Transcript_18812:33-950(-)